MTATLPREEALILTAKALAGPVVAWVTEGEPLDYLLWNRIWDELAALVIVLAESVTPSANYPAGFVEVLAATLSGRTRDELTAWITVLAREVDHQRFTKVLATADNDSRAGRCYDTRWGRPDDGVVDDVAIERVVAGQSTTDCPVPLSQPERLRAAALIVNGGGGASLVAKYLHVNGMNAHDLLGYLAAMRAGGPSDIDNWTDGYFCAPPGWHHELEDRDLDLTTGEAA